MTRLLASLFAASALTLGLSAAVIAQDVSEPDMQDGEQRIEPAEPGPRVSDRDELSSEPGSVLVLRGLDKISARTTDFEAPIGETVRYGALSITARYCRQRPPEETPEIYAFLEIVDRRTDGFGVETEGEPVFTGWMFGSNPALNPLEHPVYDVWVIDCRI